MGRRQKPHADISAVARERFGFQELRPGQQAAVEALLAGHDTLIVQPTGSGKSAVYQIAGVLVEGSTVIVSPLIALQKDQVDSIRERTSEEAMAINSTQRATEQRDAIEEVQQGKVEFIFLAPEQLRKSETVAMLQNADVSLFVVDEAHCISEWGHDFRPDYLGLGHVIEALGRPRTLALTATASAEVRDEIVSRLGMARAKIFVRGFNRPDIFLRVDNFEGEQPKRDALIHHVLWADKPGIVYTATRKAAEEIMSALKAEKVTPLLYHGGLRPKERREIQDRFMSGEADVMVATNAFGMGVDKPDIRFVYHHDPADSLDAYYQEIGRAGRDGGKAEAILFYRRQDIGAQSYKTGEGRIDPHALENIANRIAEQDAPLAPAEIAEKIGLSRRKLTAAIQRLEDAGRRNRKRRARRGGGRSRSLRSRLESRRRAGAVSTGQAPAPSGDAGLCRNPAMPKGSAAPSSGRSVCRSLRILRQLRGPHPSRSGRRRRRRPGSYIKTLWHSGKEISIAHEQNHPRYEIRCTLACDLIRRFGPFQPTGIGRVAFEVRIQNRFSRRFSFDLPSFEGDYGS